MIPGSAKDPSPTWVISPGRRRRFPAQLSEDSLRQGVGLDLSAAAIAMVAGELPSEPVICRLRSPGSEAAHALLPPVAATDGVNGGDALRLPAFPVPFGERR